VPTAADRMDVNFDTLFDDVYPDLFRYCVRLTGDGDAAEDLVQEAFVRLLDRQVEGGREGIRAWLFKVATHLVRDRVRVERNRARLLEKNPVLPGGVDAPDRALERDERVRAVRRALEFLDERDRTLLLLREEGFTYQELAGIIGVQPASVGTLLARARRRFAGVLTETMDGDEARLHDTAS
jgi:RNA polymerase sigma factor (sigma-70 family)